MSSYHGIVRSVSKYIVLRNVFVPFTILGTIAIIRFLGPVEYGKWSLIWQLISYGVPIVTIGFTSTLAKFIPEYSDPQSKNELFSKVFTMVGLFLTVLSISYCFFLLFLPNLIPIEIKQLHLFFLVLFAVIVGINLFEGFYRGYGKFNFWTVFDGSRSITSCLGALFFIYLFSKNYTNVFYSYFLVSSLFFAYLLIKNHRNIGFYGFNIEHKIWKYNSVNFVGYVFYLIYMFFNPILIRYFLRDPSQVGYYDVGVRIPQMLDMLTLAPLSVPFLYFFSDSKSEMDKIKIVVFGTKMLALLFAAISLFLFSFSEPIIHFLFTEKYHESVGVLKVYCFVPFFSAISILAGTYFSSQRKVLTMSVLGIANFLIAISLNFYLIPKLKVVGVALSSLISVFASSMGLLYYFSKNNVHLFRVFFLLCFGIMLGVFFGLYLHPYMPVPIFLLYLWTIKFTSKEEILKIFRIYKNKISPDTAKKENN